MEMSGSIIKLTEALLKARSEMGIVRKDKYNDFFRSHYADLASCIEVTREPLANNGLVLIQTIGEHETGTLIETMLVHVSGEWIKGTALIPLVKRDPQALGSAVTYGRRYSLCSILNIAPDDDDDGEAAMDRKGQVKPKSNTELEVLGKHVANVSDVPTANAAFRMIGKANSTDNQQKAWKLLLEKAHSLGLTFDNTNKAFVGGGSA